MTAMYCTPADIRTNVTGGDGTGSGTCAQLDDTALDAAIGRASTLVSAYAGTSWVVDILDPVIVIPDLIAGLTVQLATFYATLTYRKGKDLSAMDPVYLAYVDCMNTLKAIANGTIEIVPTGPADPVGDGGGHVVNTVPRTFDHSDSGTMRGLDGRVEADTGWRNLAAGWGY